MLTPAWSDLRPHPVQSRLWREAVRFKAVWAGRGSGKTELARRRVVLALAERKPWPDPIYFYALPTFAQAKRVAWRTLKRLVPAEWLARAPSESDLIIETKFGSSLYVIGMDKPHRVEGVQWDGGIIDESSDQKPGVFDLSFGPAFTHRHAWCWRIGVPKRQGVGAADFKAFCDRAVSGEDRDLAGYTWPSRDILTPEALRFAMDNLDAVDFSEQYEANWERAGGRIFHAYDDVLNVREVPYDPGATILVGSDFNVNPMCWVLAHLRGDELHVFDEVMIRDTNTPATLDHLHTRYGAGHTGDWEFYGDAAGRARHTNAAPTDYIIIRNDSRFPGRRVYYPRANPALRVRFAACNALLCNAAGRRRCFVHPRCKRLRADLRDRAYGSDGVTPGDYGDLGHMSDALGYVVHRLFPIRLAPTEDRPRIQVTHA